MTNSRPALTEQEAMAKLGIDLIEDGASRATREHGRIDDDERAWEASFLGLCHLPGVADTGE